ncbi:MAG: hypothetical protein HY730_09325, partial [Candidatus Tectomicrobia bacterium]|nr:hypothetical protein [Candidatus Tectomicrobia bacterium]
MIYGMLNGFMDALRVAGKALKEGEPVSGLTRVKNYHVKGISANTMGLDEGS